MKPLDIDSKKVKRVLIYRLGSLGDTVVVLPALHLVARTFPNARRVMLTNFPVHAKAPAASAIIGESGLIDAYMGYPIGTRSLKTLASLWWQIRRFRPELLIYLTKPRGETAVRRDARFFRLCGVRQIIGLPLGDRGINQQLRDSRWESEAARLARSVSELDTIDLNDPACWDLRLTSKEIERAETALQSAGGHPIIACGPGTKMQAKDWGTENWCALVSELSLKFPRHSLVLIGAREEREVCDLLAARWAGKVVNLCGELPPRETAAVLRKAELFLGPDSGPMHLAAAAGVPCVIAFAARTKPGVWFPQGNEHRILYRNVDCAGCNLDTCIEQKKKCLTSITVEDMVAASVQVWRGQSTLA
jgi:heptosyltransferase III